MRFTALMVLHGDWTERILMLIYGQQRNPPAQYSGVRTCDELIAGKSARFSNWTMELGLALAGP
jgi:hypothetical protein